MTRDDLLLILSALDEPIFLVRANRQISLMNRAAEHLFGLGLTGRDFVHAIRDPDALKCVEAGLSGAASTAAVITLPFPVRTIYRITSVHLESGGMDAKAIVTLADISHIHEAEQMRSDFVANVSHELRSPLTALAGGIETLKGAARNDAQARDRFLAIMEREAARMNRLVGDLLSLSRVEVNAHMRPSTPVDLRSVVEKAVAALDAHARALNRAIRLDRGEGEFIVPGDEDELTQVFHNLLDNALKYAQENTEVNVSIAHAGDVPGLGGRAVAVAVADRGPGIAPEHMPRLTERFYRVDDGRSREKGGTGLGLAIVKHVLNRHRGRLMIESVEGVGSTFRVCLPLAATAKGG